MVKTAWIWVANSLGCFVAKCTAGGDLGDPSWHILFMLSLVVVLAAWQRCARPSQPQYLITVNTASQNFRRDKLGAGRDRPDWAVGPTLALARPHPGSGLVNISSRNAGPGRGRGSHTIIRIKFWQNYDLRSINSTSSENMIGAVGSHSTTPPHHTTPHHTTSQSSTL